MIPADVRIIVCKDLFVSQSALTGESEPLEKYDWSFKNTITIIRWNYPTWLLWAAMLVSGSAICIVLATGDFTCFGSMAKEITGKRAKTNFEKSVNSVSWVLIRFIMRYDTCCSVG